VEEEEEEGGREGEVLTVPLSILQVYNDEGYLLDPHSAVGVTVAQQLAKAGKQQQQ